MRRWGLLKVLGLILLSLTSITGCRGCRSIDLRDDEGKDKQGKIIPRIEAGSLQSLPASSTTTELAVKPGHWCELRQPLRANLSDESLSISGTSVEPKPPFFPLQILDLSAPMTFDRNAVLARGQRKLLNYELFFPSLSADLLDELSDRQAAIRISISPRGFGAAVFEEAYPVVALQPYQNSIVVLSENPERYQFLGGLSCMTWPSTERSASEKLSPFRVVSVAASEVQDCLPSRLQTLTSTSHLVWNDCNASSLTEAQQQAILDWLHFGGQIIVNGPEAEAGLKGSFLEDYLPLKNIRSDELNEADWMRFGIDWSVPTVGSKDAQNIRLPKNRKVPGISGEPPANARWIKGCEGFVAEVSVAAGRIAMTTFPIGEELLVRWPSYGSFFNAAILGQPPRAWTRSGFSPNDQDGLGELNFIGALRGQEKNPAVSTKLRLLGRDLGRMQVDRRKLDSRNTRSDRSEGDDRKEHGDVCRIESDAALANVAAVALQTASGINVPRTSKIVKLLLGYFVCLVPLNWLVFRIIGRVEWAWIAAPVIAVVGAVVVAKSVQLDVGFSRSQTTLNVIELHSGYRRGHVSGFASLYTSLSTNYSVYCSEPNGIVFPLTSSNTRAKGTFNESSLSYTYAGTNGSGLPYFPVRSNSTSILRSESVHELDGAISIAWADSDNSTLRCENNSSVGLRDAVVVARTEDRRWHLGVVGNLAGHAKTTLDMVEQTGAESKPIASIADIQNLPWSSWSDGKPAEEKGESVATYKETTPVIAAALIGVARLHQVAPGETVLIGWSEAAVSGLRIQPKASEEREQTLFVVRSVPERMTQAVRDTNLPPKPTEPTEDF